MKKNTMIIRKYPILGKKSLLFCVTYSSYTRQKKKGKKKKKKKKKTKEKKKKMKETRKW
jgi:hypothetical protein